MGGAQLAQLLGGRIRARVVESHAVAQASVLHEAPQAWRLVARLRARRRGADLDEGVAQGAHTQDCFGVLVHAGGQAEARGQLAVTQHERDLDTADDAGRSTQGIHVAQGGPHESPRESAAPCEGDRTQAQVVCLLRVRTRNEVSEGPVVRASDHSSKGS